MIVAWHWSMMSAAQRERALRDMAGCGPGGKGVPPSGENGVIWLETTEGWRWRGGIYPYDIERGIRIGTPPAGTVMITVDREMSAGQLATLPVPLRPADEFDLAPARALTKALRRKPRPTAVTMPWGLRDVPLAGASPPAVRTSPGPARAAKARKARR